MESEKFTYFVLAFALVILVNTASAAINITDADAIYEANLSTVSIPTSPVPIKTVFVVNADTSLDQNLSPVSIPTQPSPLKEIFIVNEDAALKKNLFTVSIPTEPLPIKEIFIHLEDAEYFEELLFSKELINDTTPPIITNVTVTNITENSATIKWDTDEFADSLVKYGTSSGAYTKQEYDELFVKNHSVSLYNLSPGTKYYFVVKSVDLSGNSAESSEYSFTTLGTPNQPPIASFTYSPENPLLGEQITFDASSSYDPDGEIVSWEWDFGDHSTSSGEIATHSYSSAGDYIVNLTVTDNDGVKGYCEKTITVSEKPKPPIASFTYSPLPPYNPVIGENITFDASQSKGTIVKYVWDFGDGDVKETTESKIKHSYSINGTYNVNLTVTDICGETNSTSKSVTVKRPPVVLVHGFQSVDYDPEEIWKKMKESLTEDGYTVYVSHYANDMVTSESIRRYAKFLGEEIKGIKQDEGVNKVDIVAHSMGGLVSRWYIEIGGGDKNVRKLIMLETPNGGLLSKPFPVPEIATLILAGTDPTVKTIADSVDFAVSQLLLSEEIKAIIKLVKINAYICSNLGRIIELRNWDSVADIYAGLPHVSSGVIEKVHYVNIVGWLHYIPGASTVFGLDGVSTEAVSGLHGDLPESEEVILKVKEILYDAPEVCNLKLQEERDPQIQYAPLISDKILPDEQKSHEIAIGSTAMMDLTLVWSRGNLNLTLITPNGTIIEPFSIANDTNITYYTDENLTINGYTINNPESGAWKINVNAVNISEGEDYTIIILLETNITLSLSLQKYQYNPNESINITANLTYGSEAITNASVTAKIKRPDDTTENIKLFDDGLHGDNQTNDGIYANIYTNTSSWGTYDITVTASGELNEEKFERETFATVWVEQYPDLTLNTAGISFSNDKPNPGENITINATIHNVGEADANNASILFYDGKPASGELIGEDVVNVTANAAANASVSWTALSGTHHIYVLISPYNEFLEENYTNNMANKSIKVNTLPVANFIYTPLNPVVNQTITFNASSSYDPDGTIVSYEWDFGDGNITNTTHEILNHSYSEAGSYEVTLTVTDDKGATNSTTKIITVYSPTAIFDTGRPENPYPSISGEFVGMIRTNTTIIAMKLYTYACEGTGGHTEHALICNSTWCAYAEWEGYKEDWMNISFNKTVILMPYEIYNMTIVTGSYPQIHHTDALSTKNGWINCTEFVDANGKKYDNWIPAIRLE